ncbi:HNH endonuclease [Bacillus inaquosorum]|uniref:HNH endonuclease signature motif containing protein n=1 Tax=Bacillus inaquosorum TaxID=483913 RepID=UPI003F144FFF
MKNLIKGITMVVLASAFLLFFSVHEIKANTKDDEVTPILKEKLQFEVDENRSATLKKNDLGDEKEQIKRAKNEAAKLNRDSLYHYDPNNTGNWVNLYPEQKNKKTNQTKPSGKTPGFVEIEVETLLNQKNSTITNNIKITKVIGTKPLYLTASNHLLASQYYNGKYIKVLNHTKNFKFTEIKAGAKSSKSFKVGASSFYERDFSAVVAWKDYPPITDASISSPFLANKKAAQYPYAKNKHNKEVMAAPANARMPVIPEDDRTKRDRNLRKKYIAWYTKTYGDPKWNWDNYEVHHVIPLKYGGNNDMSILFPLDKTFHQKTVTPWWAAY